jgi:hypothetical protein
MECTQDLHQQQQLEQQQYEQEQGLAEGIRRRDEGLEKVTCNFNWWLDEAREIAYQIARQKGRVTSDDIQASCPIPSGAHHSLMGAVLRDKRFKAVGYMKSARPAAHARVIRIYCIA